MNILVTGTAGFIGRRLVPALSKAGHSIIGVDRHDVTLDGLRHITGDIARSSVLDKIQEPIDIVIHLAADVDVGSGPDCFIDNVYATSLIAKWASNRGVRRLVYPSTTGIFAPTVVSGLADESSTVGPSSDYGLSKYLGECALTATAIDSMVLRFPYLYGPGDEQSTLAEIIRAVLAGATPRIRDEERDYLFVDDALDAVLKALTYTGRSRTFNVGSGRLTPMSEIVELVGSTCRAGVRPVVSGSRRNVATNSSRAHAELNWMPRTDLRAGIAQQILLMQKGREHSTTT